MAFHTGGLLERGYDEGSTVTTQHTHVLPPGGAEAGVLGLGLGWDDRHDNKAETVTERNFLMSCTCQSHDRADALSSVLLGWVGVPCMPYCLFCIRDPVGRF